MTYEYPLITGYAWNAIQKISIALSIPESEFGIGGTLNKTYIIFNRDLTTNEKTILDGIMANNPCDIPSGTGTMYKIVDIWTSRNWFETQIGIKPQFWFSDSTDASGICYMQINLPRPLTTAEKKKILDVYRNMITEVV